MMGNRCAVQGDTVRVSGTDEAWLALRSEQGHGQGEAQEGSRKVLLMFDRKKDSCFHSWPQSDKSPV